MVRVCDKNAPLTQSFFYWAFDLHQGVVISITVNLFYEKVELVWFSWNRIWTPQFEDDFGINPYLNQILILDVSDWLYHVNICGTN